LTRGLNLYGRLASSEGQGQPNVQADYGWLEGEVDARAYVPLGGPKTSLQLRSRGLLKAPKGGSQIPFYDLAWLGGRTYVRGYSNYRFRGNNMLLVSTEVQRTVLTSTGVRGVDVVAFVDAGQVWGDARSSTDPVILDNQAFSSRNWHAGWGGGVQYRHSRSVAIRLEAGRSPEGTVLYLSLSRGF
jgi:outer membrane protein assembly factor BamA